MTENKRFKIKYINEQHISANLYDNGTFIGSIGIGGELIVELLNSFDDELEKNKKLISKLTMVLVDFHNRELATEKWGEHRPEFNLDKYYEICMGELEK